MKPKRLDRYSMMIVMKYFTSIEDYYKIIQVCKKFEEIPDMFHYNPIPYTEQVGNLFPNIETQYLYSYFDEKIEDLERFTVMYCIFYKEYIEKLQQDKENELIVRYTKVLLQNYSELDNGIVPLIITNIADKCFLKCPFESIQLNTRVTSIGESNFMESKQLTSITLSPFLQHLPKRSFYNCINLRTIEMPKELLSIGSQCFSNCNSLTSIT